MCLLVLARNSHPGYPLIVVANRDEYFDRDAEPAHWWPQSPDVLAGRDLEAGGTWLGVSLAGRWGAVTNYRDGNYQPAARSRGDLVIDFLTGDIDVQTYLTSVAEGGDDYRGFNVLLGDLQGLYYYSNRTRGIQRVGDGIHTLSNHLLNTPWPKSELARLKLNRLLHRPKLELELLLSVLSDSEPFDDHELPVTGVGIEMERALSPPFITGEHYGTRCTSVLLVDNHGEAVFAEQTFLPNGVEGALTLFEFPMGWDKLSSHKS